MNVESIMASFRAGILAIEMDGTVAYVNPIGEKILDGCPLRTGENINGRAGENPFFRILGEAISMGSLPTRVDTEIPGREGEKRNLGFTLAEWKSGGRKIGICAFFKDLTHVEMAEETENLNQRLLVLGQMAAGLAHEIRNPISSIAIHCSILKNRLARDEKLLSSVKMMEKEIERVEYIIRECLNFVRPAELRTQPVRIDAFIEGMMGRLKLKPGMEIVIRKPKDAGIVAEMDKGLLEQALMNILGNALDACGEKGKVTVSYGLSLHYTETVRQGWHIGTLTDRPAGEREYLRIQIRDNGSGIPEEIREKIFAPFFTTKKSGTGIGLPMAQKIVHAHGGVIDVKSAVGEGTEFIVKIPLRPR